MTRDTRILLEDAREVLDVVADALDAHPGLQARVEALESRVWRALVDAAGDPTGADIVRAFAGRAS